LIVLPLAWQARKRLAALSASDWREALTLTLVGNLIYYFCLSGAILRIGSPLAAMIIGTLPVVPVALKNPPEITMTEWLSEGNLPATFALEDEAELRSAMEHGGIIRC
ncbi:recombination-associated protein RdgC, partial [Klebsiella pneumoniae]